jgi:hypothetical protein
VNEETIDNEDEAPCIFQNSPYYNEESFNELFDANIESFKILSLNCQSLNAKFNQLQLYIEETCMSKFNAICLQETWLSDQSDLTLLKLNGFNLISKSKSSSQHGGVAIYLSDKFTHKILSFSSQSNSWDGLFIEVEVNDPLFQYNKNVVIGSVYRPPRDNLDNYTTFINELEQILCNLQMTNKEIVISGDFNIDLLKIREKSVIGDYFEMIIANGFIPKISSPTRITPHSATLIDNILTKLSDNFSSTSSGILTVNISDHLPLSHWITCLCQKFFQSL